MALPGSINIADYNYDLPADRIAQRPACSRDASRLLVYRDGKVIDSEFSGIESYLPHNSLIVFNDTRVVQARIEFSKTTGSRIEIFCLEPLAPSADIQLAFGQVSPCNWSCLVGNSRKWKNEVLIKTLPGNDRWLKAERISILPGGCFEIRFSWSPRELTFSDVLHEAGQVPLPPYITRDSDEEDADRYQTVYALNEGSVAAPTAGLHFTEEILERLISLGCREERLTLHVGLGTFRPVSVPDIRDHVMHSELFTVKLSTMRALRDSLDRPVIAVGTTSARTLESLYWMGLKAIEHPHAGINNITQWEPYETRSSVLPSPKDSLEALISYLETSGADECRGSTSLIIVPGYTFRFVTGLITNFHMPQSTLLLLIAAFAGNGWKDVYSHALARGYRFLSYGDACMFLRK